MNPFPSLVRSVSPSGEPRYALGDPLVDGYLEFVAGRCRPNTVRAVAFDLKVFFTVVDVDPVTVRPADVFEFLAHQRGDRTVVRLADRESGLSARTIARRLSSVSGFYAYLVARGDTAVTANPVPRGLQTRRAGGRARTVPLVRVPRTLPRILRPGEVDALLGGAAHGPGSGDGVGDAARRAAPLRSARATARRHPCRRPGGVRRSTARAAINDWCRSPTRSSPRVGDYLRDERPPDVDTDRVFVVLKRPRRGRPLTHRGTR